MNSLLINAPELAKKLTRLHYCDRKVEEFLSYMAPSATWFGCGEDEFSLDYEEIARYFRRAEGIIPRCEVWDEEYYIAADLGDACIVAGRFRARTDEETKLLLEVHQRITYVFRVIDGEVKTIHLHASNPYADLKKNEVFPEAVGKSTYKYLNRLIRKKSEQIDVMLAALNGGLKGSNDDETYSFFYVSDELCTMLGYTQEEFRQMSGGSAVGAVYPPDLAPALQDCADCFAKGDRYATEYRMRKKDGSLLWVLDSGRKTRNDDGAISINSIIIDITEKKRAAEEILQQKNFLQSLYNTMPSGLMQLTAEDEPLILNANRAAAEILGYADRKMAHFLREKSLRLFSFVHPDDAAYVRRILKTFVLQRGGMRYEHRIVAADGATRWLGLNGEMLQNADGLAVYQIIFSDISEKKRAELQLKQEWEHYRTAFKHSELEYAKLQKRFFMTLRDSYKEVYEINCATDEAYFMSLAEGGCARNRLEKGARQTCAWLAKERIHARDRARFEALFAPLFAGTAPAPDEACCECRAKTAAGAYRWQMYILRRASWDQNACFLLIRDIDALKKEEARNRRLLKDALAEAEAASRAKSNFLSRMSHDIRTPMNAIVGMSGIARLSLEQPQKTAACLDKIDAAAKFLLALINDILDMSRIESGKITLREEMIDLPKLVRHIADLIAPQAKEKGLAFAAAVNMPQQLVYRGDALRLNQILMNLLSNALKFTPRGGTVSLTARPPQNGAPDRVAFIVADTGVGMEENFLRRMYNPFEQESQTEARNYEGSGLGLAITHNLVRMMNGSISAASELGRGTTFTVEIPLIAAIADEAAASGAPPAATEETPEPFDFSGRRILLVEDNEINREIAQTILEFKGLQVETAADGQEAVDKFAAAAERCYDLVLMDIRMPIKDGLTATREIRALPRPDAAAVPIVAMTANVFKEDVDKARRCGFSGYVIKPIDTERLYAVIGLLLRGQTNAAALWS